MPMNKAFICGDYEYELLEDGTAEIVRYTGSADSLKIPAELDGHRVTSIGACSFEGCDSLTSVTIPDGVASIGIWAFNDCSSLTSVAIPNSVTSIEDEAFEFCESLTSVTIPDSITSMGECVFCGCTSLASVTIPDGVAFIGDVAFADCTSLASISIPDSVTSIGRSAFEKCTSLTSLHIPDSVSTIGDDAFLYCHNLVLSVNPHTVAEQHCIDNGLHYVYPGQAEPPEKKPRLLRTPSNAKVVSIFNPIKGDAADYYTFIWDDSGQTRVDWSFGGGDGSGGNLIYTDENGVDHCREARCFTTDEWYAGDLWLGRHTERWEKAIQKYRHFKTTAGWMRYFTAYYTTIILLSCRPEVAKVQIDDAIINNKIKGFNGCYVVIDDRAFASEALRELTLPIATLYIGRAAFGDCPRLERIIIPDKCKIAGRLIHPDAFADCPRSMVFSVPSGHAIIPWLESRGYNIEPRSIPTVSK